MKGVISFLLVIAAIVPLASFAAMQEKAALSAGQSELQALALEKRHYAEMELRESFIQVLQSSQGTSREEKVVDVANKLSKWEAFVEKEFGDRGMLLDVWCGATTPSEISRLKKQILEKQTLFRPSLSHNLNEFVLGWQGQALPVSAAFLDSTIEGVKVSRNGLSFAPDLATAYSIVDGETSFGASLYLPGEKIAAIIEIK